MDAQGRLQTVPVQIAWTFEGPLPETGLSDLEWAILRVGPDAGTDVIRRAGRRLPDGLRVDAVRVLEGRSELGRIRSEAADWFKPARVGLAPDWFVFGHLAYP